MAAAAQELLYEAEAQLALELEKEQSQAQRELSYLLWPSVLLLCVLGSVLAYIGYLALQRSTHAAIAGISGRAPSQNGSGHSSVGGVPNGGNGSRSSSRDGKMQRAGGNGLVSSGTPRGSERWV